MKPTDWRNQLKSLNTSKVLVADDDEATRILLRMSLTQWGYQVIEAQDGEEAWQILQQSDPPHILTLDWLMPNLDGIELCRRINKKLSLRPYIIFLTRMEGTENMIKGLEVGADEFILKPFDLTELRIRVFAGERIIKYRYQIVEQNKILQNYALHMEQLAIPDLIRFFNELVQGLKKLKGNTQLPELPVWQNKIQQLIALFEKIHSEPIPNNISLSHSTSTRVKESRKGSVQQKELKKAETIVNLDRMRAFFGDNIEGIEDFIQTFLTLALDQAQQINIAIEKKDAKTGKYFFHLLGSASGNSGMMKIYDVCGKGEKSLVTSDWSEADKCYHELQIMLKQLQAELDKKFSQ